MKSLNDYEIFLDGQQIKKVTSSELFPDTRSKNQKKKDRKEWFKQKRKSRGGFSIDLPLRQYHVEMKVEE